MFNQSRWKVFEEVLNRHFLNHFEFVFIGKMVLMNLFAGQEQRYRCREWTCGHSGGRSE